MNIFSILPKRQEIQQKLKCNFHAVPDITKIVISSSLSKFVSDSKKMQQIKQQLANITGQVPVLTKARKSVAAFKIREGMSLGYKVTLRGKAAENFLFILIYMTLPRVIDFNGLSADAFDGRGNYNMGIKSADVFRQIDYNLESNFGMNITICTTAKTDQNAKLLLDHLQFPWVKNNIQ